MSTALVIKTDTPDQRLVFGEVYSPMKPDADHEFMTADEIQKMAHAFVAKGIPGMVDVNHNNEVTPGITIVESFIARKGDPDFIEGSWVVGVHVNDDKIWSDIKKGEINGFSMEALVQREEQHITLNLPPVVSGLTSKSEDHEHTFFVAYNANGEYLGGTTSMVNNHQHAIKGGTVTDTVNGHNHKFSSVDNVSITK